MKSRKKIHHKIQKQLRKILIPNNLCDHCVIPSLVDKFTHILPFLHYNKQEFRENSYPVSEHFEVKGDKQN